MKIITGIKNGRPVYREGEPTRKSIVIHGQNMEPQFAESYDCVKNDVIFSVMNGVYVWKNELNSRDIFRHENLKAKGLYNYSFARRYEAIENFDIFNNQQSVVSNRKFLGTDALNYTFGVEFETSCGMIPEDICFRDGLIPLRDGSISGPEYSTVVLNGDKGINLLYQQIESLKKYTDFNKECALHMHLGGFPVRTSYIFTLYSLCYMLQDEFRKYGNQYIFNTARYKASKKDYCKSLPDFCRFTEMFEYMTGSSYQNSLRKPHHDDLEREHKWNIHQRYFCVNFINMLCYNNPKTVEFRFLRPTYNFTKVYTWLLVFNAILKYAEDLTTMYGSMNYEAINTLFFREHIKISLKNIVSKVYSGKLEKTINTCLSCIEFAALQQINNSDFAGEITRYEDQVLDPNIYLI